MPCVASHIHSVRCVRATSRDKGQSNNSNKENQSHDCIPCVTGGYLQFRNGFCPQCHHVCSVIMSIGIASMFMLQDRMLSIVMPTDSVFKSM